MKEHPVKSSIWRRLYHGETAFDFIGGRRKWFGLSAVVILAGLASLTFQGLNYGIEFKGGTSWEAPAPGVSVPEARSALQGVGLESARIQVQGDGTLRVQAGIQSEESTARVTARLAELANVAPDQVSVNDVGPSWGRAVTEKARTALVVFFVLILVYISLRFEWKMAVAALAAVAHDILVTVGVYSISRFEVTPATVVAFMTIMGYSLYDTIVVFDRVEENAKGLSSHRRMTYSDTVNLSMNQVLMRSLNTSLVSLLPILSVLLVGAGLLGAATLKDFGLALFIGIVTGTYSSLYIASPILAILKEREPQYLAIRQRVGSRGGSTVLTPAAAALAGGSGGSAGPGSRRSRQGVAVEEDDLVLPAAAGEPASTRPRRPSPPQPTSRPQPGAPRPRKKGKRR